MTGTLLDHHDAVLLDLDGTVYRGGQLAPGADEAIEEVRRKCVQVRYVTNNASKPAQAVADHLNALGLQATADEVSTSAQAGAALLAEQLPTDAKVLVVGSEALAAEVEQLGLTPVRENADEPVAVVQGHSPDTGWWNLAEACLAIRAGATWVACNADATLPTERGELPGNGSMVAALRAATGQEPQVAGKPERPLLDRAVSSARAGRPLMVGDRLDTDISGAVRSGMPSLMVLTGVGTPADALFAPVELRPEHIADDLRGLHLPHEVSAVGDQPDWKVRVADGVLELSAASDRPESSGTREHALGALRALCAAWWPVGSGQVTVRSADSTSTDALRRLGFA
ncbi:MULTISPECIES: HAD-IIA family hydrolase [unclassified Saccharopolyspora]|uniref:HAD-IIA family hydrolase n=1 Tax=unclassified Saccharopolyspora TaxID=2646250 RepID=UPI001CD1E9D8|nr:MULTISPECIES: HAD-IIA family hydrolase [unclassified Saccharopolyspora]MCA1190220.1 HAD-IIA family hydrolase [Saccharopolyspora sp. 6T]MCA1283515.1 HAD-IIA family hydrolase [Saccharopolyspora sp. 7B]